MNQAVVNLVAVLEAREKRMFNDVSHAYMSGYLQGTLSTLCEIFPQVEAYIKSHANYIEEK